MDAWRPGTLPPLLKYLLAVTTHGVPFFRGSLISGLTAGTQTITYCCGGSAGLRTVTYLASPYLPGSFFKQRLWVWKTSSHNDRLNIAVLAHVSALWRSRVRLLQLGILDLDGVGVVFERGEQGVLCRQGGVIQLDAVVTWDLGEGVAHLGAVRGQERVQRVLVEGAVYDDAVRDLDESTDFYFRSVDVLGQDFLTQVTVAAGDVGSAVFDVVEFEETFVVSFEQVKVDDSAVALRVSDGFDQGGEFIGDNGRRHEVCGDLGFGFFFRLGRVLDSRDGYSFGLNLGRSH